MKKLFIVALTMAFAAYSSNAQETKIKKEDDKLKAKPAAMKVKKDDNKLKMKAEGMDQNLVYPYKATYSSRFVPGSPSQAKLILEMWKDWDDNQVDRQAASIADSITMELPNGHVLKGKETFISESRQHRSNFTTVKSTVEAWMPIQSVDRNEDWVLIWGVEESTDKEGKVTTQRLHELWGFNKDGKISYVRQYQAQMPKKGM